MTLTTRKYVNGCERCARYKIQSQPAVRLKPLAVPEGPWQVVGTDLITGLPISQGYEAIFTVVDRFTKMTHFIPTQNEISSEGIANLYLQNVWKLHGLPSSIVSDRGTQFASNMMRDLNKALNIQTKLSTSYHPQTDGQSERTIQEIEVALRIYCGNYPDTWSTKLAQFEFAHNHQTHSVTKQSLFELLMGYQPKAIPTTKPTVKHPSTEKRLADL